MKEKRLIIDRSGDSRVRSEATGRDYVVFPVCKLADISLRDCESYRSQDREQDVVIAKTVGGHWYRMTDAPAGWGSVFVTSAKWYKIHGWIGRNYHVTLVGEFPVEKVAFSHREALEMAIKSGSVKAPARSEVYELFTDEPPEVYLIHEGDIERITDS